MQQKIPQHSRVKLQTALLSLGFAQTGLLRSAKSFALSLDLSVRKQRDIWLEEAKFGRTERDREFLEEVLLPTSTQEGRAKSSLLSPGFLQNARAAYKDKKVLGKLQPPSQPPPKRPRMESVLQKDSSYKQRRGGFRQSRGNRAPRGRGRGNRPF